MKNKDNVDPSKKLQPPPTVRSSSCNVPSIRAKIQELLRENPHYSPKQICAILELDYHEYSGYVRKEKCIATRYTVTVTNHDTHRNRLIWKLPEWKAYHQSIISNPKCDWHISTRNKLLFYHGENGSILWHNTGRIELFLRGHFNMGYAKQLFCKAFDPIINDWKEIRPVLDRGELVGRHHTFALDQAIPRFQIDYFARSHGVTIYNDASHSKAIEVDEQRPFWLDELQKIGEDFKHDMAAHMNLLNQMSKIQTRLAESRPFHVRMFELLKKVLRFADE
jgi:hypothetical protein